MGVGRFVCVALPFGLTICSLIAILIVMLAGVTNHNLDMFEVNAKNLSISSSSLQNLENLVTKRFTPFETSGSNITAAQLALADTYKVSLFTYCSTTGTNTTCTKAKFNWAASALNTTEIEKLASASAGMTVTLPKELKTSLHTFTTVSKWTEVVYLIALLTCVAELVVGLFGFCSRVGSCCTFLISGISTTAIIAASIMATIQSSIVVGAIDSVAKAYGVHSSINTSFLAITWLAAAFSIGGGLFWMFTICCCAADHHKRSNRKSRGGDSEKLIPTGHYQRVGEPAEHFHPHGAQQQGIHVPAQQPFGVPHNNKPIRGNGAYEPYAHTGL